MPGLQAMPREGVLTMVLIGRLSLHARGREIPREKIMTDHVYKISEIVGSSEKSIEDAIQTAVSRASDTLRNLRWFEVVQIRGHIGDAGVLHYQVTLKVGFTLHGGK
jgi:hypothetical protein